ncbi:hypothetical protein SCP_0200040 [Sparassis crispa]|uniref:Uncharacterized protein n=1 Tax=Sparassis crispa TaxID=139825 RepID=A0A401G9H3_9APHY|nr:hypothetical protein SCP_0200040 [Sparassis crispa]GBE78807.1 hypothetical protein SCP_0200040 [Sparassis crispa]
MSSSTTTTTTFFRSSGLASNACSHPHARLHRPSPSSQTQFGLQPSSHRKDQSAQNAGPSGSVHYAPGGAHAPRGQPGSAAAAVGDARSLSAVVSASQPCKIGCPVGRSHAPAHVPSNGNSGPPIGRATISPRARRGLVARAAGRRGWTASPPRRSAPGSARAWWSQSAQAK